MADDFSQYNGEGTNLRKVQLRMLEILGVVDDLCRKTISVIGSNMEPC